MIVKIQRGHRMGGLVRYLLGPGRHEEHERPHVIAAAPGIDTPHDEHLDPRAIRELVAQLDAPKAIYGTDVARGHVYHVMLSNRADDRPLSDEQWAEAAREMMSGLGFEGGARAVAPWVAFRHGVSAAGNDHVHIAVSLVREDGARANVHNDFRTASAVCKQLEARFALVQVDGRHGAGSLPALSRAELEITERRQRPEPVRHELARGVRAAADASRDEAEFVRRLRADGYAVRPRHGAGDRTTVVGYSVRTGDDERWWAGGKLAADLSLPALRRRWGGAVVEDQAAAWATPRTRATSTTTAPRESTTGRETATLGAESWREAVRRTQELVADVGGRVERGEMTWGDVARDGAGVAAALARRLEGVRPGPLAASADALARSAQQQLLDATRPRPLGGVATVVLQATKQDSTRSLLLLAVEVAGLMETMRRVHAAQAQLQRASELQRHVGALRQRLELAQTGRPAGWLLDGPAAQAGRVAPAATARPRERTGPDRDIER